MHYILLKKYDCTKMLVNDRKMNIIEQERKIRIILYMNTIEFSLHPKYTADLKDFKRYPLLTR